MPVWAQVAVLETDQSEKLCAVFGIVSVSSAPHSVQRRTLRPSCEQEAARETDQSEKLWICAVKGSGVPDGEGTSVSGGGAGAVS